jgi:hypothetical protein
MRPFMDATTKYTLSWVRWLANQRLLPTNAGSVGSEHGALALLSMKDREHPMFAFVWSVRSRNVGVMPTPKYTTDSDMKRQIEENEPTAWAAMPHGQRSFVVRLLHFLHFRPRLLAKSWRGEEVLTWELLQCLHVLPRSLFLAPLLAARGRSLIYCA